MNFRQLNLGRGKEAQNLLMQTDKERGADVLLISEQHKWSENSAWYQDASRRARILFCSIEAMVRKKVPDYLLRMIADYLNDRWVIYEGDKWSLEEEMTFGAP